MGHYLLAASSIPGHLGPLLEIGDDLARRGHDVSFLADPAYRGAIEQRQVRHFPLPAAASPQSHRPAAGGFALLERFLAGRHDMSTVFIEPLAAQYTALHDVIEQHRVDAVLCDIAFTGVLPLLLTAGARPPVIVCGVSPLMLSSTDTPPFGMGWQPTHFFDYRLMNRFVADILFRDIRSQLDAALRSVGAPKSPVILTDWPVLADHVLQLSVPGLEYPRDDLPPHVAFAGPVVPRTAAAKPAVARRDETVVHVTQGTWDNRDLSELIVPTVQALSRRDDVVVIATTGRRGCTTLPVPLPDNAFVTDYLPYDSLLPTVDLMVTNGGFGGVHHALAHGIPMVVAGATSDKPEVAARVAYAGAGIDLRTSRPKPQQIADAVDRVLIEPGYRIAAERLQREILRYNAFGHIADVLATCPVESSENVS